MQTQIKAIKREMTKSTEKLAGNLVTEEEKLVLCKGSQSRACQVEKNGTFACLHCQGGERKERKLQGILE